MHTYLGILIVIRTLEVGKYSYINKLNYIDVLFKV